MSNDYDFLEMQAVLLSDIFKDEYNGLNEGRLRNWLVEMLKVLGDTCNKEIPRFLASRFLTRRSSLLRIRKNNYDLGSRVKKSTVDEAYRCAKKAVEMQPTAGGQFELALCEWAKASDAASDEEYNNNLMQVELLLNDENIMDLEVAKLTLARFYRSIYRPVDCCDVMSGLFEYSQHRRRLLASIHLYAEATIQLWYQKYPEEIVNDHCQNAIELTQLAIDSGYRNARNVVNLAMMKAIMGDVDTGEAVICELSGLRHSDIWGKLVELALSSIKADLLSEGFLLGIGDGGIWTRLGTYSWIFLDKKDVTRTMYEFAEKLSPQNPVVLTNLARFYIKENIDIPEVAIDRLLQRANNYSDRRFRWWKLVWFEYQITRGNKKNIVATGGENADLKISRVSSHRLKDIGRQYQEIKSMSNPQLRGFKLEQLIYGLSSLTFKVASRSYRYDRNEVSQTQVDGYIEYNGEKYRIECKWEKSPLSKDYVYAFVASTLDVFGVSGLYISMSGFDDGFIAFVREKRGEKVILLMDGDEVESVLCGAVNFDELLGYKRLQYDKKSNPYAHYNAIQG